MTKYLLILMIATITLSAKAQKVTVTKLPNAQFKYKAIDNEPEFPGGTKAFYNYISKNIAYDKDTKVTDMQGTITVSMAIEKDGRISDAKVIDSISAVADKEILRVLNTSPLWKPGKQHGQPIKVRYTFKIALSNK